MTIKVGDRVPDGILYESVGYSDETHCPTRPGQVNVADQVKGRRVVVFGLPGAFTPTCSGKHLPGRRDLVRRGKRRLRDGGLGS